MIELSLSTIRLNKECKAILLITKGSQSPFHKFLWNTTLFPIHQILFVNN